MDEEKTNADEPIRSRTLTREEITATAVTIADRDGIDRLSMRRLGEALGVEAMSLYNHVANKEDLLDAMVDAVTAEMSVPLPEENWRDAMAERGRSARSTLGRHRWAIALMDSRSSPGPATLTYQDSMIGCLLSNGLSMPLTAHALAALDAFVYGFALQEAALPFETPAETVELANEILGALPADTYPHLVRMVTDHVMQPGYDYAAEFEFGLGIVIDGIARHLAEPTEH